MNTLESLKVLDLGDRLSSAWCSRLLADYGAEVLVPDLDSHPVNREAPFDSQGRSIPARYFLASKSSVSGNETSRLIRSADIILTSHLAGDRAAATLAAANPSALICTLSPWGEGDERPGNDLTACAAGGWAWVNGLQGREPLKSSGYQASYQAGTLAFGVLLAALIEKLSADGQGQRIDISEREVLVSTSAPAPLRYQYSDFLWSRKPAVDVNEGPVPVQDGWFALTISRPAFWVAAMEVLGLTDLAEDRELQQTGIRPKLKHRFVDRVGEAMGTWSRMDLFKALGERRCIAGPVLRMDELADNPQFRARKFFRESESGVTYPGPFARMGRTPWSTPQAPDHKAEFTHSDPLTVNPIRAGARGTGPLAGFRGLVLTQAWAGTYATELLALLGADVIQLETRNRLDSWRGTYQNPIPRNLQDVPSAEHAWNCSPLYNSVNLNKRCITVDLAEPEGAALFRELVVHADFVAENFSPRVMGNLGIDYETLTQLKPDLIMASLSAYGAVGPWSAVPGIGGTIEPSSGMSALLGYEGEHPMNSGQMYPDPVAGLCGFSAILLALLHRDRTGQGQYIDLSMQEANFTFIGDAWLEYAINGQVRGPLGNTHPVHAPHNIYPALGDDEWIAISAENEAQWQNIVQVLQLEGVEGYDSPEKRKQDASALDARIAQVTSTWDKHALQKALLQAAVPAAAVLRPDEIAADESLRKSGHMKRVDHPEVGAAWQSTFPARFSQSRLSTFHAPLQGQHSEAVFRELLGMDEARYRQLVEQEITGTGPSTKSTVANQA